MLLRAPSKKPDAHTAALEIRRQDKDKTKDGHTSPLLYEVCDKTPDKR